MKTTKVILLHGIERNHILNATFHDGFTSNWVFKLPKSYRSALDIRFTGSEQSAGERLTQGNTFTFKAGDTMYDHTGAYEHDTWSDAIRTIKFCIQVESYKEGGFVFDQRLEAIEASGKEEIQLYRFKDGAVNFSLFTVAKGTLARFGTYESSAQEFVRFLQVGEMILADRTPLRIQDVFRDAYPGQDSQYLQLKVAS